MVPASAPAGLAATASASSPVETQSRRSGEATQRTLAYRCDGHSAPRQDEGVCPCRRRQFFAAHSRLEGLLSAGAGNTVEILLTAAAGLKETPTVIADSGIENVNNKIEDLIESVVLKRILAVTEIYFSNSIVEAWWRSLKNELTASFPSLAPLVVDLSRRHVPMPEKLLHVHDVDSGIQ